MPGTNKKIIAVLFEVIPIEGFREDYLNIAGHLQSDLEKINGFISIERFQSITRPGKLLSLSYWENVKAVKDWKNTAAHRNALSKEYILKYSRQSIVEVISEMKMPAVTNLTKPYFRRQVKEFTHIHA